jgi:hypothetical protein
MSMRWVLAAVATLWSTQALSAQQPEGRLRGVVRDSTHQPMAAVDVVVLPAGKRARTDSAGRFDIGPLEPGRYEVRARRLGYLPTSWTVDVSKSGRAELQLVMFDRIPSLDTVFVNGSRPCPRDTYEGFLCRRATVKGTFIDYPEIDEQNADWSADLLRDVPGFSVGLRSSRNGPTRVPLTRNCAIVLLNGVESSWSQVPESPSMISAIEIYQTPREIPKEFSRFTWHKEDCWLVAYWTYDFTFKPWRKVGLPFAAVR